MSVVRLGPGSPGEAVVGYRRVVVRGDTAWDSGTTSTVDGEVAHPGDAAAQQEDLVLLTPRTLGASLGTRPVAALIDPALLVEIEADAVRGVPA